jgi:hypothetical protein
MGGAGVVRCVQREGGSIQEKARGTRGVDVSTDLAQVVQARVGQRRTRNVPQLVPPRRFESTRFDCVAWPRRRNPLRLSNSLGQIAKRRREQFRVNKASSPANRFILVLDDPLQQRERALWLTRRHEAFG